MNSLGQDVPTSFVEGSIKTNDRLKASFSRSNNPSLSVKQKIKKIIESRRVGKALLGFSLFIFVLTLVYSYWVYQSYPWSEPYDIRVTNVTGRSATISWVTDEAVSGVVSYSTSDSFLPGVLSRLTGSVAFDDRDIQKELEKKAKEAVNTVISGSDSATYEYDVTSQMTLKDTGAFYVHHVTISNLEPDTSYYFQVGNGLRFISPSEDIVDYTVGKGNSFNTFEDLDSIQTPSPSYGAVLQETGEVVVDGLVFMEIEGKNSSPVSTTLSENGTWYIDLSNIRNSTGDAFVRTVEDNDFEKVWIEAGPSGRVSTSIPMTLDAPAEDIFIPSGGSRSEEVYESSFVSFIRKLTPPVQAASCLCECEGNQSDGYKSRWCGRTQERIAKQQFDDGCYWIDEGCNAVATDPATCNKYQTFPVKGDRIGNTCEGGQDSTSTAPPTGTTPTDTPNDTPSSPLPQESADATRGSCGGRAHGSCGPSSLACLSKAPPEDCFWAICDDGAWKRIEPNTCPESNVASDTEGSGDSTTPSGSQAPGLACRERNSSWVLCTSLREDERRIVYRDSLGAGSNDCCVKINQPVDTSGTTDVCFDRYYLSISCESDEADKDNVIGLSDPNNPSSYKCCGFKASTPDDLEELRRSEAERDESFAQSRDELCRKEFDENTVSEYNSSADRGASRGNIFPADGGIVTCFFKIGVVSRPPDMQTCGEQGEGYVSFSEGNQTCSEVVDGIRDFKGQSCCKSCDKVNPTPPGCTSVTLAQAQVPEVNLIQLLQNSISCFFNFHKVAYCGGNPCNNQCGCTCKRSGAGECETDGVVVGPGELCPGIKQSKIPETYTKEFSSLSQSLSSKVQAEFEENTNDKENILLISPENGIFSFNEKGIYCTIINEVPYCFEINETGPKRLYIDRNGDNTFDNADIDLGSQVFELEVTQEDEVDIYNIELGFNFMSFRIVGGTGEDTLASTFLENLNSQYDNAFFSIAKFEAGRWVTVESRGGSQYGNNDFPILPGQGYILKATKSFEMAVTGKRIISSVPVSLAPGWNLIAVQGTEKGYTASSLIDSIDSVEGLDANNVTMWDLSTSRYKGLQKEKDAGGNMEVYGFDFPLDPLSGYFVRIASGSGTWTPE